MIILILLLGVVSALIVYRETHSVSLTAGVLFVVGFAILYK